MIVTFLLAAAATTALAAGLGGSAPPLYTLFPPAAHIATTIAGTLTIALACTAIGPTGRLRPPSRGDGRSYPTGPRYRSVLYGA